LQNSASGISLNVDETVVLKKPFVPVERFVAWTAQFREEVLSVEVIFGPVSSQSAYTMHTPGDNTQAHFEQTLTVRHMAPCIL